MALVVTAAGACAREPGDGSAPSQITGVVVAVESERLGDVRSFEVRSGGRNYDIFIDPNARYGFPPAHLSEHLTSGEPVRVGLRKRDGRLYATSIEDA